MNIIQEIKISNLKGSIDYYKGEIKRLEFESWCLLRKIKATEYDRKSDDDKIETIKNALTFYANKETWLKNETDNFVVINNHKDFESLGNGLNVRAGKIARDALSKCFGNE